MCIKLWIVWNTQKISTFKSTHTVDKMVKNCGKVYKRVDKSPHLQNLGVNLAFNKGLHNISYL